ncbi:FAD/NAD(P)-binding domain-containing protein [Zalerion maritima]|uniref:FAD/NAD(P)-binding domain-containing protein n=1 Tax=Zalerion maritima TaxID=339359 RepID=A0AAD5S5T1_9PEZI|nr:FAD/NAD(P)-binding domain-containing protein [Zalerion maritima]
MVQKHVVIAGAGAAGMSCAATLAQHPDKFKVTVVEKASVTGGQATSIPLDQTKFGADWMNNGVQGGSTIFKHTFNFFRKYGHDPQEVQLQISFGKGEDRFWTNVFPSTLVSQFSSDIKKFGTFLKVIKYTMPVLGLVPIRLMLKAFLFSSDFGDKMVYPLIALFLGTGNQTANVPSAIVERLFQDPNMKLWDYDPDTLLPNLPTMVTFDNLHDFYEDWRKDLVSNGVEIRLNTEVAEVVSRSNGKVDLKIRPFSDSVLSKPQESMKTETFDEMALCVLADDALRILGESATARERFVLGGARFYDDLTVTHSDSEYLAQQYETTFSPSLCAEPQSEAQQKRVSFARGEDGGKGFRPMYYTKSYESAPKKIEMSFDCSNYQHQFGNANTRDCSPGEQRQEYEHVYQTIFLDKRQERLWTSGQISKDKIVQEKWWHQLGHRWQHYLKVVPGMMFINGRNNTVFAGSWTLVNMHELACVSGIAAAYSLGADYLRFDDFAERFFAKYLGLSHGMLYTREENRRKRKEKDK